MSNYTPPPHREFPGVLPATDENINRLLASARMRKRKRERALYIRMGLFGLAMLLLFVIIIWRVL